MSNTTRGRGRASESDELAPALTAPVIEEEAPLDPLVQEWLNANPEDKRDLLNKVHETDLRDFQALDTIATGEKATRTSIAIEALMVYRQRRVDTILDRMAQEDERLQRQQERSNQTTTTNTTTNTSTRGRSRGTRSGGR